MVIAFIILKITSSSWRMLHTCPFITEPPPNIKPDDASDEACHAIRQFRRSCLSEVARRIQIECAFDIAVNYFDTKVDENTINCKGLFLLSEKEPYEKAKFVVWEMTAGMVFAMICDTIENTSLAEYVLSNIIRVIIDILPHQEVLAPKVLTEPEKISAVLHTFLPCGHMLFMNHRLIKQLEKDVETILSSK